MNYKSKYLKYKSKYSKLENKINNKIMELKQKIANELDESEEILEYEETPIDKSEELIEINQLENLNLNNEGRKNNSDSLLDLIKNLLEINPVVYLFITGKYASGKSTTTSLIKKEFEEFGVLSIELDSVVRDYVVDKNHPNQAEANLDAFKVYKDSGTLEQTDIFVKKTKEIIDSGIEMKKKLIIMEGALSSNQICSRIIEDNPLLTIYFQPVNLLEHKKRIVSRIKSDVENHTYSLPNYWGPNGILDRGEIESDIKNCINIEEKYSEKLDTIVKKCIEEAEIRAEQIQENFTTKSWMVIVRHT